MTVKILPGLFVAGAVAWVSATSALGNVTVTAGSGGTGISADTAQNGAAPGFTTLGNIAIAEPSSSKGDFALGTNVTLILSAPSGWRFNPGVGSVSVTSGRDLTNAS